MYTNATWPCPLFLFLCRVSMYLVLVWSCISLLLLAGHRSSSEKQFFSFPPLSDKYIYFFVVVHSLSVLFFFDGDGNKTLDVSRFHAFIYIYISFHRAREKISHAKQRISCHYYYVLLLLLLLLRYKHTYTFREKRALTSILPHLTHAIHRPVW